MVRNLVVATLVTACVGACSQTNQPPPAGSEQTTAPASSSSAPATPQAAAPETATTPAPPPPATSRAAEHAPAPAAPPPPPQFKEVTIPAGTSLSVKLLSNVASNTSHVEDAVRGSISRAVVIDGLTALPEGTPIAGTVVEANESGRVKGRASV